MLNSYLIEHEVLRQLSLIGIVKWFHIIKVFGLLLWNHYVVMGIGATRLSILLFLDASGISLYSGGPPNEVAIYFIRSPFRCNGFCIAGVWPLLRVAACGGPE